MHNGNGLKLLRARTAFDAIIPFRQPLFVVMRGKMDFIAFLCCDRRVGQFSVFYANERYAFVKNYEKREKKYRMKLDAINVPVTG